MITKVCTRCGIQKPIEDFPIHRSSRDGHKGYCKACHSESQRKGRLQRVEGFRPDPGYESLYRAMMDALVHDWHRGFKFVFVGGDDHGEPDGDDWQGFAVTRKTMRDAIMGPNFDYYAKALDIPYSVEAMRRGFLHRLGIERMTDYCEVCDQECQEYDNDGNCVHDLCRVDRDAMRAESLEVR